MVWLRLLWRIGDYLAPKKTVQIIARFPGNHAVGDIKIQKTIVVEIPRVAGPRPAAHRGSRARSSIRETPSPGILKQGITHGVFPIKAANFAARLFLEIVLLRNAQSRRRPHIRNIQVLPAIIVKIRPATAHASAHILNASCLRDIGKCSIAIAAIEIFASKIVDHIQIGPLVTVVVAPRTTKTETRVVLIETRWVRNVTQGAA